MRRTPRVVMIAPRIRARLDGGEAIDAVAIGHDPAVAGKMRVERRLVEIHRVRVAAGRVGLPNLEERIGNRAAILVEDAATDDDPLANRLTVVEMGHVDITGTNDLAPEARSVISDRVCSIRTSG